MRVALVSMPWAFVDTPSIALGILTSRLRRTLPDIEIDTHYCNIDGAEWMKHVVPDADIYDYNFFAQKSYFRGCGDWVFSSALHGEPEWNVDYFTRQMDDKISPREYDLCRRLHAAAPEFIDARAAEIARTAPDLVCLTSTVQQSVACLALARRLKQILPGVRCVMGGANCDGDQGAGLHRVFDQIDYIVRGEGERAFPELVRHLRDGTDPAGIPGLCWRKDGRSVANPMTDRLLAPTEIPTPDYDAYFARVKTSTVSAWIEPKLVVESARGCWWGEKHHCTFCGLNGSAMTFRSRPPEVITKELEHLARRHKTMDFYVVDNILDMGYLNTAVRDIAETGYDYRIHYEIKSNLRYPQLERLRDAGIVALQPGIESLSSTVLGIMDKGVTGVQNVRLMRDVESLGLTVFWNYLFGFPGETEEHYLPIIDQFPNLHHLQPPGGAARIALERFSPYFDRPELGFADRAPHHQYRMIYGLPDTELRDIAYLFATPDRGIDDTLADALMASIDAWNELHQASTLTYREIGDTVVLANTRPHLGWRELTLETPAEVAVFRALDQPRTPAALCSALAAAGAAPATGAEVVVRELLERWRRLGLVFTDEGRHIHVATTDENQDLRKIRDHAEAAV